MEKLNLSSKIALCLFGLAVVLMFVAVCIPTDFLSVKICAAAIIITGIGVIVETVARMLSKKGFRAKFITSFLPVGIIYGIVTILYLVFFHDCKALGITANVLMCVAGVHGITACVLLHIDEAKSQRIKGEK